MFSSDLSFLEVAVQHLELPKKGLFQPNKHIFCPVNSYLYPKASLKTFFNC